MQKFVFSSPAKLNLMLHIVGRRKDGYHELQSVIQFIDYGDKLTFALRSDPQIFLQTSFPDLPAEQNLIVRAAKLLQQFAGVKQGIEIAIDKKIPLGAGLGGGSSNAATVLHALNKLWRLKLSVDALAELGLQLGTDVPVFVRGQAAAVEGIGELLTPLPHLECPWYVVAVPPQFIATREIYCAEELTRNTPRRKIGALLSDGHNDFEPIVFQRYPVVKTAWEWLTLYGKARLTGTGAAVFLAMEDEARAKQLVSSTPRSITAFIARGINVSPLLCEVGIKTFN